MAGKSTVRVKIDGVVDRTAFTCIRREKMTFDVNEHSRMLFLIGYPNLCALSQFVCISARLFGAPLICQERSQRILAYVQFGGVVLSRWCCRLFLRA